MTAKDASSTVPVITLSDTPECAQQLLAAAQELGFLYIKLDGTGIDPELVEKMFSVSKELFDSPVAEKAKYAITAGNRGWAAPFTENLGRYTAQSRGDVKEAFNLATHRASRAAHSLPPVLQSNELTIDAFSAACASLTNLLLSNFARALAIPPSSGGSSYFAASHAASAISGTTLRLLMYPPPPPDWDAATDIRAGAHSDYGSLTLLFQRPGQTGLEILSPRTGEWEPVPVVPGAVCVNVGDLMSFWTAGLLRSTVHRVVVPSGGGEGEGEGKGTRYSIAYFAHPADETLIEPIPSEVVKARGDVGANRADKRGVTAGEHLKMSLKLGYGWKD